MVPKQTDNVLDLLKQGEENIKFDANKNTILVLGNTGAGKSTFTQYIAGDNSNLFAQEVGIDSGEFIILDKTHKISNSTITSKTVFPELVIDPKTNTAFYDCPGFSDTRSTANDISATYFIKKIIDATKHIKLVFIVSYPSVREGVDRQDFQLLLKHVTNTIKNMDKFKDSIALVVTKVDNHYVEKGRNLNLVADEKVIEGVANFLKGVKEEFIERNEKSGIPLQEQLFYEDAVKFIDILLKNDGKNYTKIGIIRRPNKAGDLSKIELLKEGKISLEKLVHENTKFVNHDKKDFGYTISSDSKNAVHGLVEEINRDISSDIEKTGEEIETYYHQQEKRSLDIKNIYENIKLGYRSFFELKANLNETMYPQKFVENLIEHVKKLNINVSGKVIVDILNFDKYLKFLEAVSNQKTNYPFEWSKGLTTVLLNLNNSQKWYSFLVNLYDILSKYSTEDLNETISHLKEQIVKNGNNTIKVDQIDLKQFLNQLDHEKHEIIYDEIKDMTVDQLKINALYKILDLKEKVNAHCVDNKLVFRGELVKLSDVTTISCGSTKFIEIFAKNKVIIDTDLNKTGEEVQLSVMAPTWQIIGNIVSSNIISEC